MQRFNGRAEAQGIVVTSGLSATTPADLTYGSATVTVSIHGGGLASIFSDNIGTPLANPFTANADCTFSFYAANARYDVVVTGVGVPTITLSDILLFDSALIQGALNPLAFSATPTFNASLFSLFSMTLTGNVTSSTISGGITGQIIVISLTQGAGGPWTFAWPANVANPPTLAPTAGVTEQFTFALLSDAKWHLIGMGEYPINQLSGVTGTGGVFVEQNSPTINTPTITSPVITGAITGAPTATLGATSVTSLTDIGNANITGSLTVTGAGSLNGGGALAGDFTGPTVLDNINGMIVVPSTTYPNMAAAFAALGAGGGHIFVRSNQTFTVGLQWLNSSAPLIIEGLLSGDQNQGGTVLTFSPTGVDTAFFIQNGSKFILRNITLQYGNTGQTFVSNITNIVGNGTLATVTLTAPNNNLVAGQIVNINGNSDNSFNSSFPINTLIDNQHFTIKHARNATGTGGTAYVGVNGVVLSGAQGCSIENCVIGGPGQAGFSGVGYLNSDAVSSGIYNQAINTRFLGNCNNFVHAQHVPGGACSGNLAINCQMVNNTTALINTANAYSAPNIKLSGTSSENMFPSCDISGNQPILAQVGDGVFSIRDAWFAPGTMEVVPTNITAATAPGNTATLTTGTQPHGLAIGQNVTVVGVGVGGYNITANVTGIPAFNQFQYTVVGPLANSSGGTVTPNNQVGFQNNCAMAWYHTEGGLIGANPNAAVNGAIAGASFSLIVGSSFTPQALGWTLQFPNLKWDVNGNFGLGGVQPIAGANPGINGLTYVAVGGATVATYTATARTQALGRLKTNLGTAYTAADAAIVLSTGWGTTRTVSGATGFDQALSFTVNATGTGQAANPTITITFKDGTWNTAPQILVARNDVNAPTPVSITWTVTATTLTITFNGTPTAGNSYLFSVLAMGN